MPVVSPRALNEPDAEELDALTALAELRLEELGDPAAVAGHMKAYENKTMHVVQRNPVNKRNWTVMNAAAIVEQQQQVQGEVDALLRPTEARSVADSPMVSSQRACHMLSMRL